MILGGPMNKYVIATSSTSDLPAEYLKEHNIPFISYTYTIDDKVYIDDCTEESRKFLMTSMRAGKQPNTSQITEYAYYEFLKELLEAGNDVLFVDMTRALSASINNAERAIQTLSEEYPDRKISLLDSYCVTGGLALFLKQLVKRHEEGWAYDQVMEWGNAHKLEYIHRFMVEDLQWLRRGGRLSNASALLGTILSIKPLIYIPDSGKLVSFKQVRGRKKALRSLIESCAEDMADYTKDEEIAIIHADAYEDAVAFRNDLIETYPQFKDTKISIMQLGPVIGSHVGPDFMAITYHGKHRLNIEK